MSPPIIKSSQSGIRPIAHPLPGERVLALSPPDANAAAATWLRRPNLFPGRALTTATLDQGQAWQTGRIAQRAQGFTPGVVRGLDLDVVVDAAGEGRPRVTLHLAAGLGLSLAGQDVVIARDVEIAFDGLPVVATPGELGGVADSGEGGHGVLAPRTLGELTLGELVAKFPEALPRAGVLVAQPVRYDVSDADPSDPCDQCPCGDGITADAIEDWRSADGVRLLFYAWPADWGGAVPEVQARNALAWRIFDAERALPADEAMPWEDWGVPLALIGVDAQFLPLYADRAAVVRRGGLARNLRLQPLADGRLRGNWRLPALWQAQLEQFAEQVASRGEPAPDPAVLAAEFGRLPPVGLLPANAVDLKGERSAFFGSRIELDAVPVPLGELDTAVREASPLAAIDLTQAERVRVLVPVSEASYEPRLLQQELIDEAFQNAVDDFRLDRARALGARQALRLKQAALLRAISGSAPAVPAIDDDPQALEAESLAPFGPPPAGGGHRGELRAGYHQHYFDSATQTMLAPAGSALYVWVYLDPENPPRSLVLQWHAKDWEHRAYWGENRFEYGSDGSASRLRIGDLPAAGEWLRLVVPVESVAATGVAIDGLAFGVYDGRAAFGASGFIARDASENVWFDDALPGGAIPRGDYAWTYLAPNDLWAPFADALGFAPGTPQGEKDEADAGVLAVLEALKADGLLQQLSATERRQLGLRGVDGFISMLRTRADRADDLIDLGFTKVQTDIYRSRQLMLGNVDASRLAVSPTLANIAQAETATASQEQISDFLKSVKLRSVSATATNIKP